MEESRAFYQLLLSALHQPTIPSVAELENAWKKQRPKFIHLLKHSPKSIMDRQKVQSTSSKPSVITTTMASTETVPQEYIDEALILSDIFELNELEALDLIKAGEAEVYNQFNWPRGLCAVYLFYKNRWYQAQTLKTLMRNRQGRSWHLDAIGKDDGTAQLRNLIQSITDQLWKEDLLAKLLGILRTPDDIVQAEFQKLMQPQVKGLGDPRHRSMLAQCIQETYAAVGDSLYYWCCQTPLNQYEFSSLIRFASENVGRTARLSILFSILQAVDVGILEISDSPEDIYNYAPFCRDRSLLLAFNSEITERGIGQRWTDVGMQSVVYLAWAVSLRMIAQNAITQEVLDDDSWIQDEEDILNSAMQLAAVDVSLLKSDIRGPFHWLRAYVVNLQEFQADELYQRRLHSLITQLIVYYSPKMKDWRGDADEECRHIADVTSTGNVVAAPPTLHFEQFMLLIGEFYGSSNPSKLSMSEVYFYLVGQEPGKPFRRIPQAQIALFKFLRISGEMLPSRLYVAYLRMLSGLASNPHSARQCFEMLKSFATLGTSLSALSLDNFFAALERYLRVLKTLPSSIATVASGPHILPDELKGLQTWFDLIISMAQQDDSIRLSFFENPRWSCPMNLLGLVACAVPLELKGRALHCLATLAKSPELALELSEGLFASGIVSSSETKVGGVQQELEEVESRSESYPITTGLLNFLAAVCQHKTFTPDGPTMKPYLSFVFNSVLVHLMNRNYRSPTELWELSTAVFKLLCNILENYEPTVASIVRQSVGCQVMAALMMDGPIFRVICRLLVAGVQWLDDYRDNPDVDKTVREGLLYLLKLFYLVLSKQDRFSRFAAESGLAMQTTPFDVLLQLLNPQTGKSDYITTLAMILIHYNKLPGHCLYVVRIIDALNSSVSAQNKIVKYFLLDRAIEARVLIGFVYCLSLDDVDATFGPLVTENVTSESRIRGQTASAVLELLIADALSSGGSTSLSNFLTGFISNLRQPKNTGLENPGVNKTPRTCLHAILDVADASLGQDLSTLSFGAIVEPSYRLLFWLAALPNTAETTLRYLRSRVYRDEQDRQKQEGFIYRHVMKALLLENETVEKVESKTSEAAFCLREIGGWLLKLCALELNAIRDSQPSTTAALSQLLLITDEDQYTIPSFGLGVGSPSFAKVDQRRVGIARKVKRQRRLFEFLAALKSIAMKDIGAVAVPKLQHFEGVRLSKVVASCTSKTTKGYYNCDIAKLSNILEMELVALQNSGVVAQLHLISTEIRSVVDTLTKYNDVQRSVYVLRHAFCGFAQTAQILFGGVALAWMEGEQCDQTIIETMIETLRSNLAGAAADSVADLVLNLTTILRRGINSDQTIAERAASFNVSGKRLGGLLDGTVATGRNSIVSCAGILATALKLLLEATLKTENRRPDVRASLYGALMNFFRMWKKPNDVVVTAKDGKGFERTERERMAEDQWAIVNRYAGDLVDILAKDAADGPEVTKTLAICCLVNLLEQDAMHGGLARKAFKSRGYMNAITFPSQFQKWITMIIT